MSEDCAVCVNMDAEVVAVAEPKEQEKSLFDLADPRYREELQKIVNRESPFFDRMQVQRRKDGTLYAVLAIAPTEADVDMMISRRTRALARNREQLIRYFEANLEKLNQKPILLYACAAFDYGQANHTVEFPFEYAMANLSKFRIRKNSEGCEELHADIKPLSGHKPADLMGLNINPALYVYRTDPTLWYARDVKGFAAFYFEPPRTSTHFLEFAHGNILPEFKEKLENILREQND